MKKFRDFRNTQKPRLAREPFIFDIINAFDTKRNVVILVIIAIIFPFFILDVVENPASPVNQLYSAGHFVFFALLALYLVRVFVLAGLSFSQVVLLVAVAVFFVGLCIELIQHFTGRNASLGDMGINFVGGLAGIFFGSPAATVGCNKILFRICQFLILGLSVFILFGSCDNSLGHVPCRKGIPCSERF